MLYMGICGSRPDIIDPNDCNYYTNENDETYVKTGYRTFYISGDWLPRKSKVTFQFPLGQKIEVPAMYQNYRFIQKRKRRRRLKGYAPDPYPQGYDGDIKVKVYLTKYPQYVMTYTYRKLHV